MDAVLSQQRVALAIAASVAGIATFWLANSPFGLLAPMAALFLFARGRTVLLLHAASAIGLVGSLLVAAFYADATRDLAVTWAAFFAVALCIGAIVAASASASSSVEAVQAMRIVESMPAYTWSATPDGRATYVSASMFSYIGQPVEDRGLFHELDNAGWRRVVHPDDYARLLETRRHSLRTGAPYDTEYRIRRRDGAYRWFRSFGSSPRDDRGRIVGWYGSMIDIEEQKQAEAALRDRERELSQLVDMVPSHLWRLTPDGEPIFFNRRMVDFLGLDVADTDKPGMSRLEAVIETVHPDDAAKFRDVLSRCLVTGESFAMRYRLRRADGVYRWMSSRAEPMRDQGGRIVQWYGLCHDIDDQVHAEEALRQSERRLQQLVDAVPAMIWSTTRQGTPTYLNKRYTDVTGATVEDLVAPDGSPAPLNVVHPDDRAASAQVRASAFETETPYLVRYRQIRRDGSYRWTETRAEALRDESGAILQWYGVSVDIDDMVTAQEALRGRERELSLLVDMVPSHVWRLKPDGEPTFFNKRMIDFLDLDVADYDKPGMRRLAATIEAITHPDDAADLAAALNHSIVTGESFSMRYRLRRADGVYRWMSGRAASMRDESGRIVQWYGLAHDIDDQMHAEEALRQASDKLAQAAQAASLAELSASIAHEVNQPLAAVVTNSHACQRWLKNDPPNLERAQITVERIIRDANAAAEVVSRIRALFKQTVQARSCLALSPVIDEVKRWMADLAAKNGVVIETRVDANLPSVAFDRVLIQQVLINLMRNAVQAMEASARAKTLGVRARRNGDVVQVEVNDTGPGIEHPEKIFDAFFTTKESGMGMGLAISRSIVESHGGRLWVEGNDEGGATFIFTLPIETPDAP